MFRFVRNKLSHSSGRTNNKNTSRKTDDSQQTSSSRSSTSSTSRSSSSSSRSRSVSFDLTKSEYFQYENNNVDVDDEKDDSLQSLEEFLCSKADDSKRISTQEIDITIQQMELRHLPDNDEYYFRGLESRTILGSRKRNLYRGYVMKAILTEQDRQRQENNNLLLDDEVIAQVYMGHSRVSQSQAYRLAKQDELAAQQVMLEDDTDATRIILQNLNLDSILRQEEQNNSSSSKKIPKEDDFTVSTASEESFSSYDEYDL